jgi:ParB family chromosome partitioning protein
MRRRARRRPRSDGSVVAAKKTTTRRKTRRRKVEPGSVGIAPAEVAADAPPRDIEALEARIRAAEGVVLGHYREPLGGQWLALAVLPIDRIAPTPFQRDLSAAHVKRLEDVIARVGVFLDPVVAVPAPEGSEGAPFWTPNGLHRLSALQRMGAKAITALVSPDPALAYRILALNTEKAHNTKERALEAVRMARGLAEVDPSRHEAEFALELEDGSLVTLGFAYEARARFAGGAYAAALKASDAFLDVPLAEALATREARAERLLAIDDRVAEIMDALKSRGFQSPYLRNFVVARIRPFRPRGKPAPDADALLAQMSEKAERFDAAKVREDQVARTAGGDS